MDNDFSNRENYYPDDCSRCSGSVYSPPTEFSIMAMAAIIVSFSLLLKDSGTSSAIIQKEQLDEKMINAVYSLHFVLGFTFAFFIIFLSPFVASYFNEKQLIPVLILLAFSFPIASFGTIHLALLERNARFMQIACIELSTNLLALIVTIITAYCHFDVYSLVAFMLVYTVISTVLLCSQS